MSGEAGHVPGLEGWDGEQNVVGDRFCGQDVSECKRERGLGCSLHSVVWLFALHFPRGLLVTRDIAF